MFSPYYAVARSLDRGDPVNFCALNVALYGPRKHWALTERTRRDVRRADAEFVIGPSAVTWDGTDLHVHIDEVTVPWPSRIKGTVRLSPLATPNSAFALDGQGRHWWQPFAPCARIELDLEWPSLRWSGAGYLDCNFGDEPLECAFARWDWFRASREDGATIIYDVERRDGSALNLALHLTPGGGIEDFVPPQRVALPTTFWRIARTARSQDGAPQQVKMLEDTPFYARSLVSSLLLGERTTGVHESLSLDRVANPVVRAMLPFRMPRWSATRR